MIETISLAKTASYGDQPEVLGPLRRVNFIFGTNGTGKTNISRVIAKGTGYDQCGVIWKDGRPMQALVYNRDFVERNFSRSAELKGVFTLGEKQLKAQEDIKATDLRDLQRMMRDAAGRALYEGRRKVQVTQGDAKAVVVFKMGFV